MSKKKLQSRHPGSSCLVPQRPSVKLCLFIIRGKERTKENGRKNGKTSSGSSGQSGGTSPGQTRKKPKDLSVRERDECGCGEGEGVYPVCSQ